MFLLPPAQNKLSALAPGIKIVVRQGESGCSKTAVETDGWQVPAQNGVPNRNLCLAVAGFR